MVIADEVFGRRPSSGAALPCEAVGGTVAVLEWRAWDGFLLPHVSATTRCGSRRIPSTNFRPCNSIAFAIQSRQSVSKLTCQFAVDCRCGSATLLIAS